MAAPVIAILVSLIGSLLIVVGIVLYTATGGDVRHFNDYGISIDAGSSHSGVFLYSWSEDKKVVQKASCRVENGIDDAEEDTDKTVSQLMPCVEQMIEKIKDAEHSIPVILRATAGMRLINARNKALVEKIFNAIYAGLNTLKNEYQKVPLEIERPGLLPGEKEGLFAWIAANFISKIIPPKNREKPDSTVGTLEMGGASAQIAFETSPQNANQKVKLFDQTYHVKTYSNLCYGRDQAFNRLFSLLIQDSGNNKLQIKNPCGNPGVEDKIQAKDLLEEICLNAPNGKNPLSALPPEREYTFIGEPNDSDCKKYVSKMTQIAECNRTFEKCPTINEGGVPNDEIFFAFSNYFRATRGIPYLRDHDSLTLSQFLQAREKFCSIEWKTIENHAKRYCQNDAENCKKLCFSLFFIEGTLNDIYKFTADEWANIKYVKKINDTKMGWTLGQMLVASNQMPGVKPKPPLLPAYGMVLMVLIGIILLILGAIICRKVRSRREPYGQASV
ncbi:ectonucleoside triphosphate diphosphohydrolase 2-like protein [Dinothrombium tinctorium]|uniref:Ectonucleoside triphosphate diphosphohydrolase 2-like protein n=1 Tax=Dinothrombium tinctorium TaxID=1965070 RepID=A0A3S3Q233_9ACAR|nr:ectonucleoside triphosphate diphosphohydrolase 2-like protein [Dinothrombium tinctorium]RWS12418.1 ectonucleoside triphosphate diphosphohydrolase 2-like protein [Dinothrombium tinctorium]